MMKAFVDMVACR